MDPDGTSSLKLPHSHSTPAGVDGGSRTPPTTPKKGGKMLAVRVQMLDDSITMFQVQAKALGRVLFDQVCKQLHLLEADYFGLEYQEPNGTKYWLDLEKPLSRQVGLSLVDTLLRFCVKFYTPDPAQLEEEFTRYLFCLQIKRDLAQGLLQCNDNTAALMASYIVQAECGDYVVEDYPDHTYLSTYKFVPNQDHELERRIMENHKKHAGQSPAEADLNLLETSRRCELYGMKMHAAKDHEGVPLNLAVAHMGIVVFQNFTKINTFSWAKIRKISFKRKRFLVKLHPEGYGYYKDTVEFFFEGRNECKNFWKKCVENHGFFRCSAVKHVPRQKTRVLSRGSSFRYSGKTQKQIVEFVRENYVKRQTFQRSQSFRHSSSAHSSVANVVGTSLSAHPLLPLGDNAVVGTPASLSCGSMTLGSTMEHQPRGVHHHRPHHSRDRAGNASPLLSPTHTADIHDFDTRDLTIITAGGVGTTSPSPPLTTSLSPGTSITSSPQHFYPGGRQTDDEEQEYTTAATEQTGSQRQSPYRHQNTGQNNYGSTQSHITTSQTLTTTHTITTLPRSNIIKTNTANEQRSNQIFNRPDWQRSASCRNLRNDSKFEQSSVEESVCADHVSDGRGYYDSVYRQERLIESPITRYDDSHRACYSAAGSKSNSIDRGSDAVPDTRIYSSSYPGTTSSLSTESGGADEPGGMMEAGSECILITTGGVDTGSQEEILYSHDDLSHDSYELLEREGEEEGDDEQEDDDDRDILRRRVKSYSGTRSCSLDSGGDMLPMDEIDEMTRECQGDGEVFQMEEIESRYDSCAAEYSTKDIDRMSLDGEMQVQSVGNLHYEHKYVSNRYPSVESKEESKQTQTHFTEYNAKCKPGMVVGFDSRAEASGGGSNRQLGVAHTQVERAKSDPHTGSFRSKGGSKRKRRMLTHQKSIDVTPDGSGESDEDGEGDESPALPSSRSEYNIPYTLHKRHAMNGTAHQVEMLTDDYKAQKSDRIFYSEDEKPSRGDRKKVAEKRIAQRQGSDSSSCFESSFEATDHKPALKKPVSIESTMETEDYRSLVKKPCSTESSSETADQKPLLQTPASTESSFEATDYKCSFPTPASTESSFETTDHKPSFRKPFSAESSFETTDHKPSFRTPFSAESSFETTDHKPSFQTPFSAESSFETTDHKPSFQTPFSTESSIETTDHVPSFRTPFSTESSFETTDHVPSFPTPFSTESSIETTDHLPSFRTPFSTESSLETTDHIPSFAIPFSTESSFESADHKPLFATTFYSEPTDHKPIVTKAASTGTSIDTLDHKPFVQKTVSTGGSSDTTDHKPVVTATEISTEISVVRKSVSVGSSTEISDQKPVVKKGASTGGSFDKADRRPIKKAGSASSSFESDRKPGLKKTSSAGSSFESDRKPGLKKTSSAGSSFESDRKPGLKKTSSAGSSFESDRKPGLKKTSSTGSSFDSDHKLGVKKIGSSERIARKLRSPQTSKEKPEIIVISQGTDDKISRASRKSELVSETVHIIEEPKVEIVELRSVKPFVHSKPLTSSDEEYADKTSRKSHTELLPRKRDRSPILFARARLGISEGSAFSPVHQESPASSRRAKSLDAPVVAVHRLPPIDAFSCKDDTLDNGVGKPMQLIAKRLPSPIQDENGFQFGDHHDSSDGQMQKEIYLENNIYVSKDKAVSFQQVSDCLPDNYRVQQLSPDESGGKEQTISVCLAKDAESESSPPQEQLERRSKLSKPEVPFKPAGLKTLKSKRIDLQPAKAQEEKQLTINIQVEEEIATKTLKDLKSDIPEIITSEELSPSLLPSLIKPPSSESSSFELDPDSRESRRLIKGGSSGEYQTFDDIELPLEFRDYPGGYECSAVDEKLSNVEKPVNRSDKISAFKEPLFQKDLKDEVEDIPGDVEVFSANTAVQIVPETTEIQIIHISESSVKTETSIPFSKISMHSAEADDSIPSQEMKSCVQVPRSPVGRITSPKPTTSRDEKGKVQPTATKKLDKEDTAPHTKKRPPLKGTRSTSSTKKEPIEIIRIDTESPEREEPIVTSDDEVPAIPLDEEECNLERWVSVEDIHVELLAADCALQGALDLGHEFKYIDDDGHRSPDTCSDYDNLTSSSPSEVLLHDNEPLIEQTEEFVEVALVSDKVNLIKDKVNLIKEVQKEEKIEKSISTKTPIEKLSYVEKATIATEESDSTLSSTAVESKSKVEKAKLPVAKEETLQTSSAEITLQTSESESRSVTLKAAPLAKETSGLQPSKKEAEESKDVLMVPERDIVLARIASSESSEIPSESEGAVKDEKKESSEPSGQDKKQPSIESSESSKEGRDEESPESFRGDKVVVERSKSEEEASTSSSLALPARVELSSTWRPFLLESSGSSSLEEGFFPPDEEETTSSPSNNDREDGAGAIDFPATFGYPCIGDVITGVGGYGSPGVFALSRTLSRISERSTTSEQERSDMDDDSTKPSSRSPSVDDESLLSSDHQPSLSSDPPSGGPAVEDTHVLKPSEVPLEQPVKSEAPVASSTPSNLYIPPPLLSDDDWPSPPTSSSLFETPVVSHVETFYMEIHPEEACKVTVVDSATDPTGGDGSSTDENHTLQDEDDDFLSGECLSSSATTLDGTVKVAVRPKCPSHYCAGSSLSEDTSMGLSLSEWSSSTSTVRPQCPLHYSGDDLPSSTRSRSPSYYSGAKSDTCLDDASPTSRNTYFSASKSLTSVDHVPGPMMSSERPVKVIRPKCTPYYSTAHSEERAMSRQALVESESVDAPAGWSDDRSSSSHSLQQTTGPKVRTKSYSYYSTSVAARSPPSDGDTSSSLDGSNVTGRVSRAPKRRKSQPKKRHRVTVDLEVRDGQIVEVSSARGADTQSPSEESPSQGTADSAAAGIFVPKQSSV